MENEEENYQKTAVDPTTFIYVPISVTVDGAKYYYLYVDMDAEHSFEFQNSFRINGLASVTELIDEDENVVNRYRYTPFGEPRVKIEGVFNPFQYTGRRFDNETGQYYYRARMYSPQQGRFLSNDPMGMVDGPNMYMYVRNDPVNARDPSGRNPGWGNPMLINGAAGAPDDLSTCPNDPTFFSYWDCLSYASTLPLDAAEACHARCFGKRWEGGGVDVVGFLDCLGVSGNAAVIGCIASLIGIVAAALATAISLGLALFFMVAAVTSAAISCGFAAYEVDQCT